MDLLHLELFYNGCESTDGTLGTFIFLFASYLSEKDDSLGYIGNYLLVSHIRHHTDSTAQGTSVSSDVWTRRYQLKHVIRTHSINQGERAGIIFLSEGIKVTKALSLNGAGKRPFDSPCILQRGIASWFRKLPAGGWRRHGASHGIPGGAERSARARLDVRRWRHTRWPWCC